VARPPVALTTLDAGGAPHTIPVSAALLDGDDLLLGIARSRGSLERLRADPRVAVLVLARDTARTLRGRAVVEAERLAGAERVAGVRVAIEAVDDHLRPTFRLEGAVRWAWTDGGAADADRATVAGLTRLARHAARPVDG
jgi:flavin reductase (DIM6/NTAB) family NADH-FMN oxidoreductase RutF